MTYPATSPKLFVVCSRVYLSTGVKQSIVHTVASGTIHNNTAALIVSIRAFHKVTLGPPYHARAQLGCPVESW